MPSKKNASKHTEDKVQTAAMRHPALYILSIIILVVIILTFIIGPVLRGQNGGIGGATVFGTFRGEKIEFAPGSYFTRAYQNQLDQLSQRAEQEGRTIGLQDAYNAARSAYNSNVFRLALLEEAEQAGLLISDSEVTERLIGSGSFTDEAGNFSITAYRAALESNPGLKEAYREDLVFDHVQQDLLFETGLSETEIDFIAAMGEPRRIFDIVSFEFSDFPDAQLQEYLADNPALFQRVQLSSITLNSLEEAEDAAARLSAGEISFEDLAAQISTDLYATDGGSRGTVWYYDIQRDFTEQSAAELLFSLPAGQISEIFEIRGEKYAIYRLDSAPVAADGNEDEVLQQVRGYVLSLERGLVSDYFRQEAEEFAARVGEIGWASALVESGYDAVTTGAVGINYGDVPLFPNYESVSTGILAGVSSRESLIAELFSLERGATTEPVELRDRITIIRYAEDGEQTTGQNDFLRLYIPYLAQDYVTSEMQRIYSTPDYLKDNFDQAFQSVFLGGN
jgi:hypothetical protein